MYKIRKLHVYDAIIVLSKIKTKAAANVMRSPAELMLMIEKLKAEVKALRAQLEEHGIKPNINPIKLKDFEAPADIETAEEIKDESVIVEEDQ